MLTIIIEQESSWIIAMFLKFYWPRCLKGDRAIPHLLNLKLVIVIARILLPVLIFHTMIRRRYEPNDIPLVFVSKGKMYSNAKANILTRLRLEGNVQQPLVESVVVDLSHFIYTAAQKPAVRFFGDLFLVIKLTFFTHPLNLFSHPS